jgi:tryptophanyl-tRNA synthetase
VSVPAGRLHVGDALRIRELAGRLRRGSAPALLVVVDHARQLAPDRASLQDCFLDRLACAFPPGPVEAALASHAPSVARLAALVASTAPPPRAGMAAAAHAWFLDVLAGCATASSGAADVAMADDDLHATRVLALAARVRAGATPRLVAAPSGTYLSLDGRGRMGDGVRGTIALDDAPELVARKVQAGVTDGRTAFDASRELSPHVRNLLLLLHATTGESLASLTQRLDGRGYAVLKRELAGAVVAFLEPIRRRRAELARDAGDLAGSMAATAAALDAGGDELYRGLTARPSRLTESLRRHVAASG